MKNLKEAVSKKRTVALYASLTINDYVAVWDVPLVDYDEHYTALPKGERRERTISGHVRISEPLEVQFSATDSDSVVRNAVASLDEQERELRGELARKIADIQERRNQLLALTYQPET